MSKLKKWHLYFKYNEILVTKQSNCYYFDFIDDFRADKNKLGNYR